MGVFNNIIERSELAAGDHIYTWRTLFAYSHHGIYVDGNKVVHFTQTNIVSGEPSLFSALFKCSSALSTNVSSGINVSAYSTNVSASGKNVSAWSANVSLTCTIPGCGFQQKESGVVLSCLDCFLDGGRLYRYEYGVSSPFLLSRIRGGTCTTAQSDSPEEVLYKAIYLLQYGFGNYDVFGNNCEDFALYCKTSLLCQEACGSSGQASSALSAPLAAIVSSPLKLVMSSPTGLVVAAAGMYCFSRYANDIGVMNDVTKVKVEELPSFRNRKSSKKSINENHSI